MRASPIKHEILRIFYFSIINEALSRLKKVYTRKKCKGADASVPGRRVVRWHLICSELWLKSKSKSKSSELKTGDNP